MRHPHERFALIEIVTLGIVVLFGVFALIKGYVFLLLFTFLLLSVSLCCDALIHLQTGNTPHAGKQFARALILVIFTIYLFFKL
ncbi:hypothetical protein [Oceanobacillus senegalensis]|uniref:hypothetical protein n=1 Tax=Oceanobacillus senegalensis TaxID=1936063 RepID=UPI000A306464|nr:hypothetical protein [Oceanobacillus senegalensis]